VITTHILDTALGKPAAGVAVVLEKRDSADATGWRAVGQGKTDSDGRLRSLTAENAPTGAGTYRLTFDTGAYFKGLGTATFHPRVVIEFETTGDAHYHVPLLVSPYGYTTYRGS
jgi:5-hydroxyisourate hydrolase